MSGVSTGWSPYGFGGESASESLLRVAISGGLVRVDGLADLTAVLRGRRAPGLALPHTLERLGIQAQDLGPASSMLQVPGRCTRRGGPRPWRAPLQALLNLKLHVPLSALKLLGELPDAGLLQSLPDQHAVIVDLLAEVPQAMLRRGHLLLGHDSA